MFRFRPPECTRIKEEEPQAKNSRSTFGIKFLQISGEKCEISGEKCDISGEKCGISSKCDISSKMDKCDISVSYKASFRIELLSTIMNIT